MRIYTNSITNAIYTIINCWHAACNSNWMVCQNQEYNTDSNLTPWICVYSPYIVFEPYRAQIVAPFNATFKFPVIMQASNFDDHQQAVEDLNNLSGEVYTAVSCYRDLLNTVNIVKGIEIEPYARVIEDDDNVVSDRLTIMAEVFA